MSKNVILWSKCKYRTANCQGEVVFLVRNALGKPRVVNPTVHSSYAAHA